MPRKSVEVTALVPVADTPAVQEKAIGGGLEGAQVTAETLSWTPPMVSPDQLINPHKPLADARGRDIVQNDGYATGAVALHRDNIVGAHFRLNAQPNWRVLGVSEDWAEEFQEYIEARFTVAAESQDCWFDAARRQTFTGLIRLAVGGFVMTGEVLASAEWIREARRPFSTAIQMTSPDRMSNPDFQADNRYLKRGVKLDLRGRPLGFYIRMAYPTEGFIDDQAYTWKFVPAEKPWGRKQMLHIVEPLLPDQTRGVADIVSVLKQMRMTQKFNDMTLQSAVVQATYAAAVESDMPSDAVFAMMGGGTTPGSFGGNPFKPVGDYLDTYMTALQSYLTNAKGIAIDGAMMPHMFPGTKLKVQPLGTPGGVGTAFEESLLRHIAAALGLSYEQFSRDYTKTNYSSARASMNETHKFMLSRKKAVADRTASFIYQLWLEEEINAGNVPLPPGKDASWFYEPYVKDALTMCSWIGASRGQIDELKETEAAAARIAAKLSTHEVEAAKLGYDFRDVFRQLAREKRMLDELGLNEPTPQETAAAGASGASTPEDQQNGDKNA